jgi:hypothetical protein
MQLEELADVELTYTSIEVLDYAVGGQIYGTMEGSLSGDRVAGSIRLTNLATRRSDNVNLPTLRGILETGDGAVVWVEIDGIAFLREADNARVFVTSFRCRTGDERYAWLNTTFAILEGVLDKVAVGGVARGRLHACSATIT